MYAFLYPAFASESPPYALELALHQSGQPINFTQIGGQIGLDDKTTRKYVAVLEQLFLVRRLEPWFRNRLKRSAAPGVSQLYPQFRLCRHLCAACLYRGDWFNTLGQFAPVVLALLVSVRHWVDWGKPFHRGAHRALRSGVAHGGDCVFGAPAGDYPFAGAGLTFEKSDRA